MSRRKPQRHYHHQLQCKSTTHQITTVCEPAPPPLLLVDADALDPEPLSACIPPLVPADTVESPFFICILPSAPAVTEVSPLFTVTEPSEAETLGVADAEADADEEFEALLELLARMR